MDDKKNTITIAYFTNIFPYVSATFISREVKGLRNIGLKIKLFSVQKSSLSEVSNEDKEFIDETFYIFPIKIIKSVFGRN